MKILNISNMPIWLWGKGKGIPSIFYPQREFAKRGFEVHFLCPKKEGEPKYSLVEGVHIYSFDFPFNFRKSMYLQRNKLFNRLKGTIINNLNWCFFQVYSFFWGVKIALKIKPDIVYAHSLKSAFVAYLISKFFSAKFIMRLYGTGQLYWKYKSFWYRIKWFREYIAFKLPVDYFVITNDGSFGNLLAKKLGVPNYKIKHWRNGIDEDFFKEEVSAKEELSAKEEICKLLKVDTSFKIIASTCRLIPDYGVDKLLSALVDLFKKNKDWVCVIAGSGPEESKLKEFAEKNGISSRVYFLGIVDRQMIRKILNASDIFVFLARYYNCTNTMWEAISTGCCIVTTQTEAIKEVLTSGENAILVPPNDFDKVSKILEKLLSSDELRSKLGRGARIRAEEVLESWEERVEEEAALLKSLVER